MRHLIQHSRQVNRQRQRIVAGFKASTDCTRCELTIDFMNETGAGYLESSVCIARESNPQLFDLFFIIHGGRNFPHSYELEVVNKCTNTPNPKALRERDFEITDTWKYDGVLNHVLPQCQHCFQSKTALSGATFFSIFRLRCSFRNFKTYRVWNMTAYMKRTAKKRLRNVNAFEVD